MSRLGGRASRRRVGALLLVAGVAAAALALVPRVGGARLNPTITPPPGNVPGWPAVSGDARRLHERLLVADLHADALLWERDLLRRGRWGHVDVPRLVEGRVALQAFTVVTRTSGSVGLEGNADTTDHITLLAVLQGWPPRTWRSLVERALHQAGRLRRFASESDGRLVLIRTRQDLEERLAKADAEGTPVAGFLGLEGAHALGGELASLDRLHEAGFRMIGLVHFFDNDVGGSAHGVERGGLTPFGERVLDRMAQLGMAVDLAHASPTLIDDVLARTTGPVIVSHTGVKGTCDNPRNLDDERLAAIGARGGVVGIGLWETALCGVTPADWARAVRHATRVMGVDHVALGSDWDGAVTAVVDAAETVRLTQALMDEGFTAEEITGIMGRNVTRVLLETLPSATDGD